MKKKITPFLITFLILFSCDHKAPKSSTPTSTNYNNSLNALEKFEIINVPEDVFEKKIDLSSFISNIEFLALETTESCLIGKINKILSDTTFYIIHDKDNNTIYRFDKLGNFINQIGSVGDGPAAFKEAYDVSLNTFRHEISVLDLRSRKILIFNYEGEYIETKPIKFLFTQHEYLNNGSTVFNIYKSTNSPDISGYKLIVLNKSDSLLSKSLPYKDNPSNTYTTINPLRIFSGKIYFNDPFKNRIFGVNENGTYPVFKFDFGKNSYGSDVYNESLSDQEIRQLVKENVFFSGEFIISDSILIFGVFGNDKAGVIYYSLETNDFKYDMSITTTNRMHMLLFRSPKWLRYDNRFISSVDPYEFLQNKKYIYDGGLDHLTKNEQEILLNAKEGDNPVLMFYHVNKF